MHDLQIILKGTSIYKVRLMLFFWYAYSKLVLINLVESFLSDKYFFAACKASKCQNVANNIK